ncbi:MAG: FeoB-associated Cys-rich membrane protein [Erysipelotrichia bacterium]|nr:FeoB-associated Cys-rich membrane protein [Erysipelotrichia bacterium]
MSFIDYIIIMLVAVIFVLAIKNSKKNKCIGCIVDCSNCPSNIYKDKKG